LNVYLLQLLLPRVFLVTANIYDGGVKSSKISEYILASKSNAIPRTAVLDGAVLDDARRAFSKADAVPGIGLPVDGGVGNVGRRIIERHRGIIAAVIEARIANRDVADGEIARVGGNDGRISGWCTVGCDTLALESGSTCRMWNGPAK
jgi:hypothetical protein